MSDILLNPAFPQEELEKAVNQSVSALAANENDANFIADNIISAVLYGTNHPYSEVITMESLQNITREHMVNYYNTFFRPNSAYLVIVGDITVKEAKKLTKKYFKPWKKGVVPKFNYPSPQPPAGNQVAFANRERAVQSVLAVSYPVELKPGTPDAIKVSVMNSILGGGEFSGRLTQNLREDKAYTYGAYSSLTSDKLTGRFMARTEVGNHVTDSALVEILHEMNRIIQEPVARQSLDLTKNYLNGSFARSLESPRTIATFALNIERYNLSKDYYKTYLERLAAVTVTDVSAMAEKYLRPENAFIVVSGNKEEVAPKLSRFSKSGQVLFYDSYGRKLEITENAIPAGMTAEKILDNYINALGGVEKLGSISSQVIKMTTEMQGMVIEMVSTQKAPDKILITTSMGGNIMQKQVFDGERGQISAMGQKMELTGSQLVDMKSQARIIPELDYRNLAYQLKLVDMESIEGKPAYKVQITSPEGSSKTEFFDVATGLKIRTVASQDTPMGAMTIAVTLGDYRSVDGIKVPFSLKQVVGPQTIDLKVASVEFNSGIPDDVFSMD